jgi:multidrug efflux pump subunit AcrB
VPRYNLYPAAELDGVPAPGYSQGQAIQTMQQLAAETLPDGFTYEWTTLAFQQMRAGSTAVFAFVLAWCSCSSCWPPNTRASPCRWR